MNLRKQEQENIKEACQLSIGQAYEKGLFQICPINKSLNKSVLSMAYTPGVGTVCMEIKKKPELVDELTLRGRSVAIVTQGNCFENEKIEPGQMTPIVDWCIAQIRYYACIDSFPFLIRHGANINNVLKDISNSYSVILILDLGLKFDENQMPKDVAIVRQQNICKINSKQITDCQQTSKVVGYLLHNKVRGIISQEQIKQGLKYRPVTFKPQSSYFTIFRDGRSIGEKSLDFHRKFQGKIHIQITFENITELRKCLTASSLLEFVKCRKRKSGYQNISAIVTDGTAILGLGDIGPRAGLPVMEGKSLLFKVLGGVNVVPICINKRSSHQETIQAILDVASYFKAINLEDFKAPQCFFIERGLKAKKILPVFHDDQHGTSIVTLAAMINALKLAQKKIEDLKIIISGVGAAGITICLLLIQYGAKNVVMLDTKGAIYQGRQQGMNDQKIKLSKITNPKNIKGPIGQVIKDADVFIGVSGPGILKKQMVKTMAQKPIIFALANPDPQITLDDAIEGGAFIYGSGRSDFKNQINNSLVFPGIFRGIQQHDLPEITDEMKMFIAELIAKNIDRQPTVRHIITDSLDLDIPIIIANGLKKFKPKENSQKSQKSAKL